MFTPSRRLQPARSFQCRTWRSTCHPKKGNALPPADTAADTPDLGRGLFVTREVERAVTKVEWRWDESFQRVGFIVTNMTGWSRKVVQSYNGRGTGE